jgi:hypothetical protein
MNVAFLSEVHRFVSGEARQGMLELHYQQRRQGGPGVSPMSYYSIDNVGAKWCVTHCLSLQARY